MCSSSKMSSISSPSRPLPTLVPRTSKHALIRHDSQFGRGCVGRRGTNFPFLRRLSLPCRERC
jgi:hypothetical protein